MRTAAAYVSKLKAEALGRTYKVQDTNHRLFTTTLYRGAAGCGPVNYDQIEYVEPCKCDYIGPARRSNFRQPTSVYDGGNARNPGERILDGGLVNDYGRIVDGGFP
jgi:hypothetical protein